MNRHELTVKMVSEGVSWLLEHPTEDANPDTIASRVGLYATRIARAIQDLTRDLEATETRVKVSKTEVNGVTFTTITFKAETTLTALDVIDRITEQLELEAARGQSGRAPVRAVPLPTQPELPGMPDPTVVGGEQ